MAERSQNLQDLFLNSVRKQKISLTIFLINGVKLTGIVTSFDNFCVLLRRDGHSQLVYKHAISTIMPSQRRSLTLSQYHWSALALVVAPNFVSADDNRTRIACPVRHV